LKTIVSRGILKKMILANITLQNLKNIYNKEGIVNLLSKKNDDSKKCLVTKNKNVILKISQYLKNNC